MKKYFVSYYYEDKRGNNGHGRTELACTVRIRSLQDVFAMEQVLKKQSGFKQCVILNWNPFEIETEFSTP